jgi:beta-phosphoglucomutase-like phosphatase (HAD superfamily)
MSAKSEIEAVIFDMDDTLVSSASTWKKAETRLYRQLGSDYRDDIAVKYKGLNAADVAAVIHDALRPSNITAAECGSIMREYLIEEFGRGISKMAGSDDVIHRTYGNFRLAIASGSPPEAIAAALQACGWTAYFELTVSSEQVANGKPAPDVFLETASLLSVSPSRCLVIEDSYHGVQAAKAAGMMCFAVPSGEDSRIPQEADDVFSSLDKVVLRSPR